VIVRCPLAWFVGPQNASAGCVSPFRVSIHQTFIAGTMSADPFVHLPHLREKLIPADKSTLRLTPEALAVWDQRARDSGRPANWRLPDDVREASRNAVLGNRDASEDLWVYAYASLMWDPGLHFAEVRTAEVEGYQRRFTLKSIGGRGTQDHPCLFLSLEKRPGTCAGLAFRISAQAVDCESTILWRREMTRGSYAPVFCRMRTPQGDIRALLFASNPLSPNYFAELPLAETAAIVAAASGPLGTNREYLEQVAAQLLALQIRDDYIADLLRHVQRSDTAHSGA
jgi:glutathione-specific gamma-glutamylcyclotransferase